MPLTENPKFLTQNFSSAPTIEGNDFLLPDHPQGFNPSFDGHYSKTTPKSLGVL